MDGALTITGIPVGVEDLLVVVRLMIILAMLMYSLFAFLVIRQVQMMESALNGVLPVSVKTVAWVHLFLSIVVLGVALVL